jgi:hypothetical protein
MFLGVLGMFVSFLVPDNTQGQLDDILLKAWSRITDASWHFLTEQGASASLDVIQEKFGSPTNFRFYTIILSISWALIGGLFAIYLLIPYQAPVRPSWENTPPLVAFGLLLPTGFLTVISFLFTLAILRLGLRLRLLVFYPLLLFVDLVAAFYFSSLTVTAYFSVEEHIALINSPLGTEPFDPILDLKTVAAIVVRDASNFNSAVDRVLWSLEKPFVIQQKYPAFVPQIGMLFLPLLPTLLHFLLMISIVIAKLSKTTRFLLELLLRRLVEHGRSLGAVSAALLLLGALAESLFSK